MCLTAESRRRDPIAAVRVCIAILLVHAACGCASHRTVQHPDELAENERAVVLDLHVRKGDIQRAVLGGALAGAELVMDERIPTNSEGRIRLNYTDGTVVEGTRLNQGGASIAIALPQKPMYLLSLRAISTHGIISTYLIHPMFVRIPRAKSKCEYAGTLHIWFDGEQLQVRLRDELETRRKIIEGAVQGCILTTNLARQLTTEDLKGAGYYYRP